MSSSNIPSSSDLMDIDSALPVSFKHPSDKKLGKRKLDEYNLDENLYRSFNWNDEYDKRIKLDMPEDRKEAINARPSFTNLVSSAFLILPPEVDTVVITRDKFVVEWNESYSSNIGISPTQVMPALAADREEIIKNEIHRSSFNFPFYYCNSSTSSEIINKIKEERRIVVSSQISNADTSLSPLQLKRAASVSNEAFKEKAAKKQKGISSQEKLLKISNSINESLDYFEYIPAENVPVRDKRTVSILLFLFFIF